ncbi:MAG: alpha/beta hydrolase [Fibrobacteria bacterium]
MRPLMLFVSSALLFLASLLAVFKPPSYSFWKLSIVIMEGGHFAVLPCLLAAWLAFRHAGNGKIAAALFLAAALLFALTSLRAICTARGLQREFAATWGHSVMSAQTFRREWPLNFRDLFLGVSSGDSAHTTLVYKQRDSRDLRLDFYPAAKRRAARPRGAPCVVVVHGGGWDGGSRSQLAPLNGFLASEGYAVAALEYSLAPKYQYPAPVLDVADALAYLKTHADAMGIDPSRFIILGRSAGGQIALQAAYTLNDPDIKGVIAFYAPADMVFGYSLPTNPLIMDSRLLMRQYLGGSYADHPEAYAASSPVEHLAPGSPPTLLLQGRPDVLVSYQHAAHMRERMRKLGVRHFIVDIPWGAHGFDFVFRGPGSQISLYFVERFLAAIAPVAP